MSFETFATTDDERAPLVAVIGAGFSGVLTALHLLRRPDGPRVALIERGARFARGAAYATGNPNHLLNVRVANMSAFPEAPDHFLQWLGVAPAEAERLFVTRDRYGQYLQALLRETAAASGRRLTFEHDAAVGLAQDGGRWRVALEMGRFVGADAVVLAIGNLPPCAPAGVAPDVLASRRWVADPWAADLAQRPLDGEVLLIGSGLTAIDVALTVQDVRPGARVTTLSRHGLPPQAHAPVHAVAAAGLPTRGSPGEVLRAVRAAAGEDWRAAIDALRPSVQAIWRGWDLDERRRFLRHLRPWWEVARHRLAPDVAALVQVLREEGRLQSLAGRLVALTTAPEGLEARWRPRGGGPEQVRRFALAVNCAGPLTDLDRSTDPLVRALLDGGHARPDPCGLGLEVDEASRLVAAAGEPNPRLFAVGPLTRGQVYEMTSVPDIRIQAAQAAQAVIASLEAAPAAEGRADARLARALEQRLAAACAELELEIAARSAGRRVRTLWELRGRKAALEEMAAWLETQAPR